MVNLKCAYCGDENFRRANPDISDWYILVKSEPLPPKGDVSIDVFIQPPIEEEERFCGFGCLGNWIKKRYE